MTGMVPGMVFVFGSNDAGIHGGGAALAASRYRGFPYGVGEGVGRGCYAIPTKDQDIQSHTLAVVRRNVWGFICFAQEMYDLECAYSCDPEVPVAGHTRFQVTRIGCGLAGFQDLDIAPLFEKAPPNCFFDEAWKSYLGAVNYWGTFP